MKTGRYSNEEMHYISDNAETMDYRDIAAKLGRRPIAVKRVMEKMGFNVSLAEHKTMKASTSLRQRSFWPVLEKQFDLDELHYFETLWIRMFEQFKNDVLPTEELQMVDTIRMELLINRNLKEQQDNEVQLHNLENELAMEKSKDSDVDPPIGQDDDRIMELERNIAYFRAAKKDLTKNHLELQDKKNKLFGAIKGTRADRIKQIESSKESFTQWLTNIIKDDDLRQRLGHSMEKVRLSVLDEEIRLAAYHKYEDGTVDQPFLTPDTVKDDNRLSIG